MAEWCRGQRHNGAHDAKIDFAVHHKITPVNGDEKDNHPSLDQLWDQIRRRKERQEAKRPTKSAMQRKVTPPQLKRKKSIVSYRESHDGRTKTAIFDLPGVKKHHIHINFRSDHMTVEWTTVTITETEEDGRLVRERKEKIYTRTIPVPQGTKFEEVCATMDNSRLILTYPNMRTVRVDRRKHEFGQGEPRRIEPTEVESTDVYEY